MIPDQVHSSAIEIEPGVTLAARLRNFFYLGAHCRSGDARVGDREEFQAHLTKSLATIDEGLSDFEIPAGSYEIAKFAVVAFIDESILASADRPLWAGHTLEQKLWHRRIAGEAFFVHLDKLEEEADSLPLCNILELYCLCLMLGFKGKHTGGDGKEIGEIINRLHERTRRIRNAGAMLAPEGALPPEPPLREPVDRWAKSLKIGAAAVGGIALSSYAGFLLDLNGILRKLVQL
jgi:type VI secretion system protein ImpK